MIEAEAAVRAEAAENKASAVALAAVSEAAKSTPRRWSQPLLPFHNLCEHRNVTAARR